jgi:hypothetical protein
MGWLSWQQVWLWFPGSLVLISANTYLKKLVSKLVCGLVKWFRGVVVASLSEYHIVCTYSHLVINNHEKSFRCLATPKIQVIGSRHS